VDDGSNYEARDELDVLYDQLDELVESTKQLKSSLNASEFKCDTSLELITLMMEEVPVSDIRIYKQIGGAWVAEVKYHGINFVHINGKHKPEVWEEFDNEDG